MPRPLHESSIESSKDKASANAAGQPVMVYVCECGVKWTGSTKTAWACKCGRPLVKRNGIIHTAIRHTSAQVAGRARSVRMAAVH
jgi:hypothetical protein